MTRAVVIQTAFLGDAVLTTPLISLLAQRHGPVDVVTTPQAGPIFETLPSVEHVVEFDKRGAHSGIGGVRRISRIVASRQVETAYLPHRSIRSALVARLARVPRRIGFRDTPARWMYTERRIPAGEHETDRLCSLFGPAAKHPPTQLAILPNDESEADEALTGAGVAPVFAVVAPGSQQATKRWPYYPLLAERLSESIDVVLLGRDSDRVLGNRIVPAAHAVVNLAGRLSIRASASVVKRARLVVCNDSFVLHLAGAVGTPVVAIFGPTDPRFGFGPVGPRDVTLGARNLPCRPCSTHGGAECPLRHHKCMVDLHVDTVTEAVFNLLDTIKADRTCV